MWRAVAPRPTPTTVFNGTLPAGTTLNASTGTVSGTPTTAGGFSYSIRATDSGSPAQTVTNGTSGTIAPATLTMTSTASATTQIGQAYSQTNVASGGTTPYSYALSSGTLPAGTTLNASTGTVSGTPTTAGSFSYSIRATDSGSPAQTVTNGTSGTIAPTTLTMTSTASATTKVGASYSQTNVASGGTTSYSYTLASGALPAGTTLSATTGTVSGTPTTAGSFSYSIRATDSGSPAQTAIQTVSGSIGTATTTMSITSSANPSSVGQSVTFTATVVGTGATGTVTFKDGATTLGTGTLSAGAATFTTSSLTLGIHSITAVYGGDGNFTTSTSAALQQSIAVPADSLKLRAMQINITPVIAQISGQAISGAIDNAIEAGFSDNPQPLTPNGSGFTYQFWRRGERSRARRSPRTTCATSLPRPISARAGSTMHSPCSPTTATTPRRAPRLTAPQREWLGWLDMRGVSVDRRSTGNDLKGDQINATAGLTRKLTPDFLIGAFGGYEHFDYSSDALNGRLKGDGWTVGSYLGWRLNRQCASTSRWRARASTSMVRPARRPATFPAGRWLASSGLTGTYRWQALVSPAVRACLRLVGA